MTTSKSKAPVTFPTYVDIGPFRYQITTDPNILNETRVKLHTHCAGFCDADNLLIGIDVEEYAPMQIKDTLLHEIRHGVAAVVGVRGEEFGVEEWISRTNNMLLDVLRRNQHVVAFLLEPVE